MSVKSFLRRLSRLLFVTNPAGFWLLLREGKEMAISYLYQVWTIYLWRKSLCMRGVVPCLLPEGTVSEMFPDVDLTQVTLLFPLPRPGGVQMHELALLVAIVRTLQPKRLVEIGTAEGRTTINLALHSPPMRKSSLWTCLPMRLEVLQKVALTIAKWVSLSREFFSATIRWLPRFVWC